MSVKENSPGWSLNLACNCQRALREFQSALNSFMAGMENIKPWSDSSVRATRHLPRRTASGDCCYACQAFCSCVHITITVTLRAAQYGYFSEDSNN